MRTGLIPRLLKDYYRASCVLKQVSIENGDAFLQRLLASAERNPVASENVMDIVSASEISR